MKRIAAQLAAVIPLLVLHGALGFLALIAYVSVTAGVSIADTAKTRATEARVNGIVTQLGTTNSNVTTAQSTANTAQTTANNAQTTANNALPKSGGTVSGDVTITGSLTVDTNLGVHGGTTMVGASSCSGTFAIDGGASMPNGALGSAPSPPNGTGGSSQYAGNFFTGSGASTWAIGISNKVDGIISALQVNNVTN